ncbi:MAG: DoxX family protein [Bacteroidota bacterium]
MNWKKITYWTSTGLLSSTMLMSSYMYLSQNEALIKSFSSIGLPLYFVMLLGSAKLIGSIALLVPLNDVLKEWAYAGFSFVFAGAAYSHIANGQPWIAPLLFLMLLMVSYVFWKRSRGTQQQH